MNPGIKNANVLPDPVLAIPIKSCPFKAIGQPWDWIAVGSVKPKS